MKKLTVLTTFVLFFALSGFSEHVEPDKAQKVANTFLNYRLSEPTNISLVDYVDKTSYQNFYVFGNEHCFVIIAADNCAHPVLGYSTGNPFGTGILPDNVSEWLRSYDAEIADAIANRSEATDEITAEWDNLLNGRNLVPKSRSNVSPLIRTRWDQWEPYNNLCPYDANSFSPNHRVPTGCVATAMAQIINFWEHPVRGTGSHSYDHPTYGLLSVNYGNTVYDWDNMKNRYDGDYSDTESNAVATLMYHCGVAVNMNYSTNESGAYSENIPSGLMNYFDYSSDMSFQYRASYTDGQWISMLKTELDNERPLYYSGSADYSGGHAFICDGYDENDDFHFNWGWGGFCDGYYTMGALNPHDETGNMGSYNFVNCAIFGCQPNTPPINPPTVAATVNGRTANITWNTVSNAVSYKLYRDHDLIANLTSTSYTDSDLLYGSHTYFVKSVKSDGTMSLKSNSAIVEVVFEGPVATNLQYSINDNNIHLSWTAPESESAVLQYGSGSFFSQTGYGEDSPIYWAQRYTFDALLPYAGMAINKVSVYFTSTGTYTLFLYKGDEQGTTDLFYQINYTASTTGWNDINIPTPVSLDFMSDLWVVMYSAGGIQSPAATCIYTGPGKENAALLSNVGGVWWSQLDLDLSWMMKTYITDGTYTYNIYRNDSGVANNVNDTYYNDNNLTDGVYSYYVKTNYFGGESGASNQVTAIIGDPTFSITASANPSAGGHVTGDGTYSYGASCTLTAEANPGYTFTNWTENGNVVSTQAHYSFNVNGNRTLVANFTQLQHTITVSANPNNGGTVTGDGTYNYGQSCTLTATPSTGYSFVRWTKNGNEVSTNTSYTFTVTESATYVAHFQIQSYTITATANLSNGGTATGGGTYSYGQSCTLTATPNQGYTFTNWTENGNVVSSNAVYTFTVNGNRTLVANFSQNAYTITASANPSNGGTTTGGGTYSYGQSCTLTAMPNQEYTFTNWTENGNVVSSNAVYTFTVSGNRTLVAHFNLMNVDITTSIEPAEGGIAIGGGTYNYGDEVTITVEANEDWTFRDWTENGVVVTEEMTYSFIATANRHFVAHLEYAEGFGEHGPSTVSGTFTVYPNPANNKLNVEAPEAIEKIEIYNLIGSLVYCQENCTNKVEISTSGLQSGPYLIRLTTSQTSNTIQFVKE